MRKSGAYLPLDHLIEAVANSDATPVLKSADLLAQAACARDYDCSRTRVVVLGGGTGLSTVIGGNSRLDSWPEAPAVGLKKIFPHLDVVVCTTDDGGSTGRFLQDLPMIGIGDMRKACLSMIRPANIEKIYGLGPEQGRQVIGLIHQIFNHRFPDDYRGFKTAADPLLAASAELRKYCPPMLRQALRSLGAFLTPAGQGPTILPGGHCLGNLLLTAAILRETGGRFERPARPVEIRKGLDHIARLLGITRGCLHPATAAPGELVFRYANGVEVQGQSKATSARRGYPVEAVCTHFHGPAAPGSRLLRAIARADLIVLAPGSLYTSIIPVLQAPGIADAVRANRGALKILGANFWIEEGETDITHNDKQRGYRISEMIEAYDRNVPGGAAGLFHCVLCTNLEHVPGSILRNYALEGKRPIYLDRQHVQNMGVLPVEATLFSLEQLRRTQAIQHNPEKFALAMRTLLYVWKQKGLPAKKAAPAKKSAPGRPCPGVKLFLCRHWEMVNRVLSRKDIQPARLRTEICDMLWANRDITAGHLDCFRGARVIAAKNWNRSTEWDTVLGYYDPADGFLKIHGQLTRDPVQLRGNLLIALGESLLGRYIMERRWVSGDAALPWGMRSYEIRLRPANERNCFLNPAQLDRYLLLSRMLQDPARDDTYRITLHNNDGFIPPGLLFGLMYAWYLDNSCAPIMENEMSILHWQEATLIPHQVQEYRRKKALVDFFRKEIFGYADK